MNPQVSVIVPTTGRETLFRVLSSLRFTSFPSDLFEVVVVVDGLHQDPKDRIQQMNLPYTVRTLFQIQAGAASARNHGAREAAGSVLLFLDDDIEVSKDLIEKHYSAHTSSNNILAFGKVLTNDASPDSFLKRRAKDQQESFFAACEEGRNSGPFHFSSANFSIQRDLFNSVTGFDEKFGGAGWEEADLGIRLLRRGIRIVYLPNAIGTEYYSKTVQQASMYAFEKGKNEVLFMTRYPGLRKHSELNKAFHGNWGVRLFIRITWRIPRLLSFFISLLPFPSLRYRASFVDQFWNGVKSAGMSWSDLVELFGRKIPVLAYHDITLRYEFGNSFDVKLSSFWKQMQFLKNRGYTTISIEDYRNWLEEGVKLPAKPVVLTLDDGYQSFFLYLLPLLKEMQLKATMFICPELVGKENEWDQLLGGPKKLLMNWAEIEESSRHVDIGAHGMTHRDLCKLSQEDILQEVARSREIISQRIKTPEAFCYPFGNATEQIAELVRKAGFSFAFTAKEGMNSVKTEPRLLRRVMVKKWDVLPLFIYKLKFGRALLGEIL